MRVRIPNLYRLRYPFPILLKVNMRYKNSVSLLMHLRTINETNKTLRCKPQSNSRRFSWEILAETITVACHASQTKTNYVYFEWGNNFARLRFWWPRRLQWAMTASGKWGRSRFHGYTFDRLPKFGTLTPPHFNILSDHCIEGATFLSASDFKCHIEDARHISRPLSQLRKSNEWHLKPFYIYIYIYITTSISLLYYSRN
jgi:hypothetical protein